MMQKITESYRRGGKAYSISSPLQGPEVAAGFPKKYYLCPVKI
ncbi:hypothetical protein TFUB20_01405 [Tannerella forsythia]|uniref:Uncharacterized protein n=1 Tax=Tannerella forsythia TaxID=28112 RepID=A0A1D3UNB3_TANFO|nr:hypothetical protein TFUB20_01405 [Tannerella forsythia]